MSTVKIETKLVVDENYWMVGEYFNMPQMSLCRLYGDADDPETCGGDADGNVYVVVEGPDGWEASGYVKKSDLASSEELLAALAAYRPHPGPVASVLVTSASDGAVATCKVFANRRRPQMSVVRDRDLTPEAMTVDRLALREEFRDVARDVGIAGIVGRFADGGELADFSEFQSFKRSLSRSFGICVEIDEWMVR